MDTLEAFKKSDCAKNRHLKSLVRLLLLVVAKMKLVVCVQGPAGLVVHMEVAPATPPCNQHLEVGQILAVTAGTRCDCAHGSWQ